MKIVVQDLMPGLAEGVQLLQVGGKALFYVPPALAFPEDKWPADIPTRWRAAGVFSGIA